MNPLKLYTELSVATFIVLIFWAGQSAKIIFEIKNQNYVQDKKLPFISEKEVLFISLEKKKV